MNKKNKYSISLLLILLVFFSKLSGYTCSESINPINQVDWPISIDTFNNDYLSKSVPVVFKGAASSWEASSWDFQFFLNKYPDVPVEIQIKETLTDDANSAVESIYVNKYLKDYILDIQEKGIKAGYLSQFNILKLHPVLEDNLQFPEFFTTKYLKRTNIWIGPKGTKSKLHYDSDHNLFVQLEGKKLVTLISPEYFNNCYPVNVTWYDGYSPIDVLNPDYEKYPKFKEVKMLQYLLEVGDMLYIPKGWWHDIRSIENSISVNLWWINWRDFAKELYDQIKYQYIEGKTFDIKNSYWNVFKDNLIKDLGL